MTRRPRNALAIILLLAVTAVATGCRGELASYGTHSEDVAALGADEVRAWIEFGDGELVVDGAGDEVMNAEMTMPVSFLKPRVQYEVKRATGELLVMDRNRRYSSKDEGFQNDWILSFAQGKPIELRMSVRGGTSIFEVADLDIHKFQLRTGGGDSKIDLAGNWDHDVDVDIDQGVGDLEIALPKDMPLRVGISEGSGVVDLPGLRLFDDRYLVNEAYTGPTEDPTVFVNIERSSGKISLILRDR